MKILVSLFLLLFYATTFAAEITLRSNNTVSLNGPVNSASVSKVMLELQSLDSQNPS